MAPTTHTPSGRRPSRAAAILGSAALVAALLGACTAAAASFEVAGLEVAAGPAAIEPGDEVDVVATVANGGGTAGTFVATLIVDGTVVEERPIALEPGDTAPVRFTVVAGDAGAHEVRLGDATATFQVTATASFELGRLRIVAPGHAILAGDDLEATVEVRNGGTAAGTYRGTLEIDGVMVSRLGTSLEAGETTTLRYAFSAGAPGRHEVTFDEARATYTVVEPASFALSGLEVTPNPAESGGKLDASIVVANRGGVEGTVSLTVTIDGRVRGRGEVAVAGGDETTAHVAMDVPKPGPHVVAVGDLSAELLVWKIERPTNGKVFVDRIKGGLGRLTVKNGNDVDAMIVLAKPSSPTKALLAAYVRAGKSMTVTGVRDGTYVVYFSIGTRWDAFSRTFTSDARFSRFEDTLTFDTARSSTRTTYSIWTITLHAVAGGNAPADPVDEGDFPPVP